MQVNQNSGFKGSFGIPPHMKAAMETAEKAKAEHGAPSEASAPKAYADEGYALDGSEEVSENTTGEDSLIQKSVDKDPLEMLKENYDIEITGEDIQRIIFKGYTEKDVIVLPSILGSQPLIATFKTLTGSEYELADEKLAEEIRDIRMTNDGFAARRGVWLLAYGLKKIQGKLYYKQKFSDDAGKVFDKKATLESRKNALGDFSPVVLSKMMAIQSDLTIAINYLFSEAKGSIVKKP